MCLNEEEELIYNIWCVQKWLNIIVKVKKIGKHVKTCKDIWI